MGCKIIIGDNMVKIDASIEIEIIQQGEMGKIIDDSWKYHHQLQKARELFDKYATENPTREVHMAFAILLLTCRKFDATTDAYCSPELARYILEMHPTLVNTYDECGATPVMYAIRWNRYNVLATLLCFKPNLQLVSTEVNRKHQCLDHGWNVLDGCFHGAVCGDAVALANLNILRLHLYKERQNLSIDDLQNIAQKLRLARINLGQLKEFIESKFTNIDSDQLKFIVTGILYQEVFSYGPKSLNCKSIDKFVFSQYRKKDYTEDNPPVNEQMQNVASISSTEQKDLNTSQTPKSSVQSGELVMFSMANASSFIGNDYVDGFTRVNRSGEISLNLK
jgi:hypothetical protein